MHASALRRLGVRCSHPRRSRFGHFGGGLGDLVVISSDLVTISDDLGHLGGHLGDHLGDHGLGSGRGVERARRRHESGESALVDILLFSREFDEAVAVA